MQADDMLTSITGNSEFVSASGCALAAVIGLITSYPPNRQFLSIFCCKVAICATPSKFSLMQTFLTIWTSFNLVNFANAAPSMNFILLLPGKSVKVNKSLTIIVNYLLPNPKRSNSIQSLNVSDGIVSIWLWYRSSLLSLLNPLKFDFEIFVIEQRAA